jgi:tRNA pseudouridine38-40 synthase
MTERYAIKLAYDGRYFHGYARQPDIETVEGTIIQTCIDHDILQEPLTAKFQSSSRTDKGVSSLGTVISFNTQEKIGYDFFDLINEMEHIVIYGIRMVDPEFYPRYAKKRIYRYYLKKNGFEKDSISSSRNLFIGTHNFTNFARIEPGKKPVRTIDDIKIIESDRFILLEFHAQTYLWHQIRRIISALIKVEQGKITRTDIQEALDDPKKPVDFGLAPPSYLLLEDVVYDFSIPVDKKWKRRRDELGQSIIASF